MSDSERLKNAPAELYPLIDRLREISEINHPTRKWSIEFYYECAFQWMNKIDQLKERINDLESKLP